jgi:alpha-D-xyloside xylohydrolase
MKKTMIFLSAMLIAIIICGCASFKTELTPVKNGIRLSTRNLNVIVQFYDDDIVRVIKWLPGGTSEKTSLSVIIDSIPEIAIDIQEEAGNVMLRSSKLLIKLNRNDGHLQFISPDNSIILNETGKPEFTLVVYDGDSAFSISQSFSLKPDEGVYGLGQHQNGYFNYRGKTVKLVQTNTDAVIPFLISTQNYGILWDNYSKTIFKDDETGTSLWSDAGDNLDYYFIYGKNMDKVIAGYRHLTGQAPMYGKWAYGYWQSKEHYENQAEIMAVATQYRKLKIPIDNIIQDWDYWNGAGNWSGMFFDRELFPSPKEMVKRFHQMNFHMMISIWPALGPNTAIYKDMLKHGFLYKPVGWAGFKYYDAFNPAANRLYWEYLKKGLYDTGIDAWWIDSTEPDVVNALTKESTEYEMKKMGSNYLGSWGRYLNAFSLVMTDAIYSYWRDETSDRRAYILTRSTFAGQQRNASTTWSGDIGANWEVYKNQISAGINHCMSGVPYWTFDIGAFVIGAYEGLFNKGGKDPAYQELYTRMFQFGAFAPIFRSHGSETPREIWEIDQYSDVLIRFDNLRYRLMPYIYSLAWKVTSEGYTYMRGLPMDFAADKNTLCIDDQFMFGPAVMVCPVTGYMYHKPPEHSRLIAPEYFRTKDGKPGLNASYYKDDHYQVPGRAQVDSCISIFWYTGRPDYVTDSMFSIRWEGKLIPKETGTHQFHMKSFDRKRIILDGHQLPVVYTSTEQYTDTLYLEAGKEYSLVVETENNSTGAARMLLFWKTPGIFARERTVEAREKNRKVYLPSGLKWFDFWTGGLYEGGQNVILEAPIDKIPLLVKAGSILPMGPFLQYATEKPANPLELRIYPGADGTFTLYEDENDNYNYEKGIHATIDFIWNETGRALTIEEQNGHFPGMLEARTINIVLVRENHGTGIEICNKPDKIIQYNGHRQIIQF